MTNEEAIEQLKNYHYENGTVPQEIIMAIEALRQTTSETERRNIELVANVFIAIAEQVNAIRDEGSENNV